MSVLLELRGLTKTFHGRRSASGPGVAVRALGGIDLSVASGEHLSIVGGSGCGKTTLARAVLGLTKPDSGAILFRGNKVDGETARLRDFRRQARMVFQDPFASLDPRFSVRAILQEALCLETPMKAAAREEKMRTVLRSVELAEDILGRYPHEFSGGERQRISLARALMTDPALLILDEAVSSVDVLAQQKILNLLARLQARLPVTYIFISHNLRAVRKISRKIAVMSHGRIVEYGAVADIFERPAHRYTRQLLRAALEYRCEESQDIESSNGTWRDIGGGHWVLSEE
ncbi:MAG: ABC transporter ATP-binding protein [Candidatus Omnitrophica bacterium]|nr:ABC transporter ATP-binding protein [Candidatus Omnitrophota bacterium]